MIFDLLHIVPEFVDKQIASNLLFLMQQRANNGQLYLNIICKCRQIVFKRRNNCVFYYYSIVESLYRVFFIEV